MMQSVHVHVSQIAAPLLPGHNAQDGSRLLLVQLLPSASGTNVEMRGTDVLRTRTVWTFEYSAADKNTLALDFVLREQVSIHKILEIGHLRIPFNWLAVNHVIRESFHMHPIGHDNTIIIYLEIHLNENGAEPFDAPFTLVKPRMNITPVFNDTFETVEFPVQQYTPNTLSLTNQIAFDAPLSEPHLTLSENTEIFSIFEEVHEESTLTDLTLSENTEMPSTFEEEVHEECTLTDLTLSENTEMPSTFEEEVHEECTLADLTLSENRENFSSFKEVHEECSLTFSENTAFQREQACDEEEFDQPLFPMPSIDRIKQAMQEMQNIEPRKPAFQWSFFPTEEITRSFYTPPAPLPIKI